MISFFITLTSTLEFMRLLAYLLHQFIYFLRLNSIHSRLPIFSWLFLIKRLIKKEL